MDDVAIARVIHVVAVVFWIGGVAMVTTVLLPAVRRFKEPAERVAFFETVERRFAGQARVATLLVGLSGLHMIARLDLWDRFDDPAFWWMHAMVALWAIFSLMLFVLEPLFLHRWFLRRAERAPEATFALVSRLHWVLLTLSVVTVAGAVAGAHGWLPL
jgi:putative copper export protein